MGKVMSLGEPDSEIFVRRYKFDEKIKDISKAMGLNISTVKTRLSRGKENSEKCYRMRRKIMRRKNLLKELGIPKTGRYFLQCS
ncbi:MAG: sigma factor-like helix-turn-helix DNA-binding protein [Blautia wexlerae]